MLVPDVSVKLKTLCAEKIKDVVKSAQAAAGYTVRRSTDEL